MRKVLGVSLGLLVLSLTSAFAFDPDELNKITFTNATGARIETIFLSPSDSDFWGPDIIGADDVLKDGGSIGFYVHYPDKKFTFDIMANDEAGNSFEVYKYQMTDGKEATIMFTKKNLTKSAPDFSFASLEVENGTDHDMQYLFVSPSDSDAWGVDLLNEDTTLAAGDSHWVVIPMDTDTVTYNLMATDENDDEYLFDVVIDPSKGKELHVTIEQADLTPAGSK
jgi:hypothetical protein